MKLLSSFILPKQATKVHASVKKILFVRIDRVGDMVLSTPAIKALKVAWPQAELTVLASPANREVLTHNPYVDRVLVYNKCLSPLEKWRRIRRLKDFRFDLAVDPYADYELRTALISFFSGAAARIGYAAFGRKVFFNLPAPSVKGHRPFVDITLDILRPLAIEAQDKKPEIFLSTGEKNRAREWLLHRGLGEKPLAGVHPGAYYESQRWPAAYFAQLIDLLVSDGKLNVLLFGGPGDEAACKEIAAQAPSVLQSFVATDIREFSALLACCRILICNNSGPLHMAVALKIPTVSTMGPTLKERWMPAGDRHKVLRIDRLPCIGCNLGYCKIKTHDCMRLITPPMVKAAADALLHTQNTGLPLSA